MTVCACTPSIGKTSRFLGLAGQPAWPTWWVPRQWETLPYTHTHTPIHTNAYKQHTHTHTPKTYFYRGLENLLQSEVLCSQLSIVNSQDALGILYLSILNLGNVRGRKNDIFPWAGRSVRSFYWSSETTVIKSQVMPISQMTMEEQWQRYSCHDLA